MKEKIIVFVIQIIFTEYARFPLCEACSNALGMENESIKESQITAVQGISQRSAIYARYNSASGWCTVGGSDFKPGSFNPAHFLQIDLLKNYTITSVLLQGLKDSDQYSYGARIQIQYQAGGATSFQYYKDLNGSRELQTKDLKNNKAERITFNPPLCAQYFRYLPFISENAKCIRLEIFGCAKCQELVTKTPSTTHSTYSSPISTKQTPTSEFVPDTKIPMTTLTDRPGQRKSKTLPVTLIVVIVVIVLSLLIIIIVIYLCRSRLRRWYSRKKKHYHNRRSDKRKMLKKDSKKNQFLVKYDIEYSDKLPTGNIDDEQSLMLTEKEKQNTEPNRNEPTVNYSEVYAAPTISSGITYNEVIVGNADEAGQCYDTADHVDKDVVYAPPVSYPGSATQTNVNDMLELNPIYEGSQIYENPYQTVTGSSLYADPEILGDKRHRDIKEFPRNKLRFIELIGEGQFGEVYICEVDGLLGIIGGDKRFSHVSVGVNKVAVKMLKSGTDSSVEEEFMKEVKVMARLEHGNVVQLIGVCHKEPKCMVVEFLENGDLMQFLQGYKRYEGPANPKPNEIPKNVLVNDTLLYIAMQIAAGMNYLSSQGFVHRDLATRNCLVGHSFTVKIADFGMSRCLYSKQYYRIEGKAVLPIRWMAPESLYYGTFTSDSDVWAFAVTVWEIFMFVIEQPYEHLSDQLVIENACIFMQDKSKAFKYLRQPLGCPDDVYSILLRCWQKAPETRPGFGDLLEFFKLQTKASIEVEI